MAAFLLGLAGVLFFGRPRIEDASVLKPKIAPPKNIEHFSFGYNETMADSLWIRLIQNFDFCDNKKKVEEKTLQATEDTVIDSIIGTERSVRCHMGWAYQMLDRVTDLSPNFYMAYIMGATTLSIIVDDVKGASLIFDKGIKHFPKKWSLAYRAAYHELYETKNLKKAADYLYLAGQNGAPIWVQNLASKLYERSGQLLLGRTVLMDLLERSKGNKYFEDRARKRLDRLNEVWEKMSPEEKINQSNKSKK